MILGSHFPQAEFAYNSMTHGSTKFSRTLKGIDFMEKSNKKHKALTRGNERNSLRKKI